MGVRVQEVVIDCADPAGLAAFWAQILEAEWASVHEGWAAVNADPVLVCFQKVPEPKQSPKNRVHLDVEVDDWRAAALRAEALGARRTGHTESVDDANGYAVLQDPEGNEFCVVADADRRWSNLLGELFGASP